MGEALALNSYEKMHVQFYNHIQVIAKKEKSPRNST